MGKVLVWATLIVVALVVVGMVVASVVGALLKLAFYLVIGVAVVGGGLYVFGRVRAAIQRGRGGPDRQLRARRQRELH